MFKFGIEVLIKTQKRKKEGGIGKVGIPGNTLESSSYETAQIQKSAWD